MRPTGKINLIAVVVLAAVLGGFWWLLNYAGVYLDNLDVRDAVKGAYNSAWHVPDHQLRFEILHKVNSSTVGWHEETDQYDRTERKKGLGLTDEDVTVERDEVTNTIKITASYKRKVYLWPWPGKDNVRWVNFTETKQGPIKSPEAW